MVGRKTSAPGGAEEETRPYRPGREVDIPAESLADRVARLELEKREMELELEIHILRARTRSLPDAKQF